MGEWPSHEWKRVPSSFTRHLSHRAVTGSLGIHEDQFNQLNRKSGHWIKYANVDADPGKRSPSVRDAKQSADLKADASGRKTVNVLKQ